MGHDNRKWLERLLGGAHRVAEKGYDWVLRLIASPVKQQHTQPAHPNLQGIETNERTRCQSREQKLLYSTDSLPREFP